MELKVLVDNNTIIDRYFLAEPGVSYLILDGDKKILFDTGYSDVFIENAQKLGETLLDLDCLVLSHGHNDHTGGIPHLTKKLAEAKTFGLPHKDPVMVAHTSAFAHKDYYGEDIGSPVTKEQAGRSFELRLTNEPQWLTENLVFLGEIPRNNDFEGREEIGHCECHGKMISDTVLDDSALAYKAQEGLVIITGCSHAGICNIIEYAKSVCQDQRLVDVIGGFHLLEPTENQAKGTLEYFKNQTFHKIHPSHCTSLEYKIKLSQVQNVQEVGVGMTLTFD